MATYFAALALLLVCAAIIAAPLLEKKRRAVTTPTAYETLEVERRVIIRTIRELDEDHRTGKIDELDHRSLRQDQVQRGAEVLHAIEQTQANLTQSTQDTLLEREIAILRIKRQ